MTVAETAELIMALKAHGRHAQAEDMLGWLAQFRDENGAYWMGMQVEERVFWPVERPLGPPARLSSRMTQCLIGACHVPSHE